MADVGWQHAEQIGVGVTRGDDGDDIYVTVVFAELA